MTNKIFLIALLTVGLGYATHTFAFGAILEAITDAVVQGVVGLEMATFHHLHKKIG